MREKSEDAEPVIDRYRDHALFCESNAIEARDGTRAASKAAAVQVYHHRHAIFWFQVWRPEVKVKAVLTLAFGEQPTVARAILRARRAILDSLTFAAPGLRGLRRLPAQSSDRCCRKRDAQES